MPTAPEELQAVTDLERLALAELERYEQKAVSLAVRDRFRYFKPLPTQAQYLETTNHPDNHLALFYGPNGCGKSKICGYCISSEALGRQPHDGTPRPMYSDVPYPVALLVPDYDNHARKFLEQDILYFHHPDNVQIERTHEGAPRRIFLKDPFTGRHARHPINIYTSKQDVAAQEAPNLQALYGDEPPSRAHYIALSRGLRQTHGKVRLFGTLVSEPWIEQEVLEQCGNMGGSKNHYSAFQPDWRENLKEYGGYVPMIDMERFWEKCDPEELEARKFGQPFSLTGRVFREFDPKLHVIDEIPLPREVLERCPRVLVVDPHPRRPFAMLWAVVGPDEELYVYNEWPPHDQFGDFHRLKHSNFHWGDYARIISEGGPCMWNLIDPNAGNSPSEPGGLSTADRLTEHLWQIGDMRGFMGDADDDLITGYTEIHQRLKIPHPEEPISYMNRPGLQVLSHCKQTIRSLRSHVWDDHQGRSAQILGVKPKPREKDKDFVDLVRYLCVYPIFYISADFRQSMVAPRFQQRNPFRGYHRQHHETIHGYGDERHGRHNVIPFGKAI